ncbi:MAG: hypothetical protein PHI97_15655 [Desulfobulbus sp.]|nr:hypothetical protein [Desulfobulbus sp.]
MATVDDVNTVSYSGINAIDALIEGIPAWNYLTPERTTLYYSFELNGPSDSVNGITAFNSDQETAAITALDYITSITGIHFEEAKYADSADLYFAYGDIISGSNISGICISSASWSYTTIGTITYYSAISNIFLDNNEFEDINIDPSLGSGGYQTLLHELGHALGLKHPFEPPFTLPDSTDNTDYTLMSYKDTAGIKSTYQEYDLLALYWLYGNDGLGGTQGTLDIFHQGTQGDDVLLGTSLTDILYGESGNDTLNGGLGNDIMRGGLGNDTYIANTSGDIIIEESKEGLDTVRSSVNWILGNNIERLTLIGTTAVRGTGNALANKILGNSASNVLNGRAGNDILNGALGNDTLRGGIGNDTYIVNSTRDIVVEFANQGLDTVRAWVDWTLGDHCENLVLLGNTDIEGLGNALSNTITGNDAGNLLDGKSGADRLIGGNGHDTYKVDNVGDVVVEGFNKGSDIIISSVRYALPANVEGLYLAGKSAISGSGNALDNLLLGNESDNVLNGNLGMDTLRGRNGNDTLNGGNGNDTLTGGSGRDTFVFRTSLNKSKNTDTITDFTSGTDKVQLDKTIFKNLSIGNLNADFFRATTDGASIDINDHILYNTTTGALLYDYDGINSGAAIQFALLKNKPSSLSAGDFVVVA